MRLSDNWCSFWIVTLIYTFAYMLITHCWLVIIAYWCLVWCFMYCLFWSCVSRICFHGGTLIWVWVVCSGVSVSQLDAVILGSKHCNLKPWLPDMQLQIHTHAESRSRRASTAIYRRSSGAACRRCSQSHPPGGTAAPGTHLLTFYKNNKLKKIYKKTSLT